MIVMKFGGTSVADAERIGAAAEIVRTHLDRRPVVVVSALAGVTDRLVEAIAAARQGDRDGIEGALADISRRHRWALSGAIDEPRRRHDVGLEVDALLEDLRQLLRSVRILGEGTPRAADALLAFGETLSSRIVVAALGARGLPAVWIDPRDVIATDDHHGAATPDGDAVAERAARVVAPAVAAGRVPVIGGFVGATIDGHTTTLGRGGSDTTAAVLGAALAVDEIQIWTDVDGILTADPRLVPTARVRARVSFAEAAELAFYGAKVLHPASIAPAVARGIPVRVLNARRPEASGTSVVDDGGPDDPPLASIASRAGCAAIRILSTRMRADPSFASRALQAVEAEGLVPDLVVASEVGVTAAVSGAVSGGAIAARLGPGASAEVTTGLGVVCVVGRGLAKDPAVRRQVLAALAEEAPVVVAMGGAATSAAALVGENRLASVVQALHRRFFEAATA